MEQSEIFSRVDYTVLKQTATWDEVKALCEAALRLGAASVCIAPSYVKAASDFLGNRMKICTVIGFPNGYNTSAVKAFEAERAVHEGADEIDMVVNLGMVRSGDWEGVLEEIKTVKEACGGRILKVIVETCLLTDGEKERICDIISRSGADFIKTSTGFSTGGAEIEDIKLFRRLCAPTVRIKAAGGIRTLEKAEEFIKAGADRIGSSGLS